MFDTLVFPVLNYAAEIWGAHNGQYIEVIHTKFCRKLLTVKRSTNLDALYGELGRIAMLVQRKIIMVKYWLKILTLDNNSILSKTYRMLKSDLENGLNYNKTNWAFHIKNILEECGLTYLWQNQPYIFIHFHTIKQRILDIYFQTWYASINNSTRLQTYNLFKHIFKQEEYLDFIKEKKFRVALTKFRTSAHELEIESGLYTNITRERRLCNHCNCRRKRIPLFAYMPKIRRFKIKIHKTLLLDMAHNTKIHKFNVRKFQNHCKKYSKIYILWQFETR